MARRPPYGFSVDQTAGEGHQGRSAMDTHQPVGPGPGWLRGVGSWGRRRLHPARGAARGDAGPGSGAAMRLLARSRACMGGRRGHGWPPRVQLKRARGRASWLLRLLLSSQLTASSSLLQLGPGTVPVTRPGPQAGRQEWPQDEAAQQQAWPQVRGCGAVPASASGGLTRSVTSGLSKTHV